MDIDALLGEVQEAFTAAGGDLLAWPDPHPDRQVGDEEYSRVSDPAKYRLVGMRTAAWTTALTAAGLASIENLTDATDDVADARALWRDPQNSLAAPVVATWLRPVRTGGLSLLLCRNWVGTAKHEYVLVGAGEPAVQVSVVPDCGCDACDCGSADLLELLDRSVVDVLTGDFIHITAPRGVICGRGDGWEATGRGGKGLRFEEVEALLEQARAGRCRYPVVHGPAWW